MCCEIRPEFKACYWMLVGEQRRSRLSGNAGYTIQDNECRIQKTGGMRKESCIMHPESWILFKKEIVNG